jgi:hypothetical protein
MSLFHQLFSYIFSFQKVKEPYYPFITTNIVFCSVLMLPIIIIVLIYGLVYHFYLVNVLKYSLIPGWLIFNILNFIRYKRLLRGNKIQELEYKKVKKKYLLFLIIVFSLILIIIFLSHMHSLQHPKLVHD